MLGIAVMLLVAPFYLGAALLGAAIGIGLRNEQGRRRLARVKLGPHDIFATVPDGVSIDGGEAGLTIQQDRLFVYVNDELVPGDRR